jgi:hypothetical protein
VAGVQFGQVKLVGAGPRTGNGCQLPAPNLPRLLPDATPTKPLAPSLLASVGDGPALGIQFRTRGRDARQTVSYRIRAGANSHLYLPHPFSLLFASLDEPHELVVQQAPATASCIYVPRTCGKYPSASIICRDTGAGRAPRPGSRCRHWLTPSRPIARSLLSLCAAHRKERTRCQTRRHRLLPLSSTCLHSEDGVAYRQPRSRYAADHGLASRNYVGR